MQGIESVYILAQIGRYRPFARVARESSIGRTTTSARRVTLGAHAPFAIGYRDQIVTCDVGVSLNSKTHPLFMKYSNGTSTQCYAYHYPSLFPVLFLQSLYVPF